MKNHFVNPYESILWCWVSIPNVLQFIIISLLTELLLGSRTKFFIGLYRTAKQLATETSSNQGPASLPPQKSSKLRSLRIPGLRK